MPKFSVLGYSEVVKQDAKVVMLAPGIFDKKGGMFAYANLWVDEIKKYNSNAILLLDHKNRSGLVEGVEYQRFISERKKWGLAIALIAYLFSTKLSHPFFSDYLKNIERQSTVHILTSSLLAYPLVKALLNSKRNLTIIYTLHDPMPHDEKVSVVAKLIKGSFLNKLFNLSAHHEDFYLHLHSVQLIQDCPPNIGNVIVHPHPLPKTMVEKKQRIKNNKVRFGFLGRIEPYKGLDVLYKAFKNIQSDDLVKGNVELEIVGRGHIDIKKWEQLDIPVNLVVRMVSDEEFHRHMANLDCLILPYKKASQSGVGYLALAYGIPIIATDTGGLPEIIAQSKSNLSKLVPIDDEKELTRAILEFINKIDKSGSEAINQG
ncbi:MAG: glycosyltransferase family 4 protein [Allomuricauda sp.]